jgi:hypothetical protein
MKPPVPLPLFVVALASLISACATSDLTPLLSSDDCGPKPANYKAIAAAWLNTHYHYVPPNPIRPEELSVPDPVKVATVDEMMGRQAGWQVILGPENKNVRDFTDAHYTRLIINHDRVVCVTSSDRPFETLSPIAAQSR